MKEPAKYRSPTRKDLPILQFEIVTLLTYKPVKSFRNIHAAIMYAREHHLIVRDKLTGKRVYPEARHISKRKSDEFNWD